MRGLRLILAATAVVAGVLLLGVWQVPQWLDWNRYRGTIEVLASATLGQPVTIRGPISLALLPQPVLTASQVNVGGNAGADFSIGVEALRLRVALWPLIGGRVDARELVLRGADLRIPGPVAPGMLRPRPPAWLAAFAARIENGRLTIGQLAFTGVDATLETLDTGALSAKGAAQFGGQEWHFTARLTAAGADGAAGLNATLDGLGKANGLGASFAGQWAKNGTLAGSISGRGPNLAILLPTPAVPFRADGRLTVGHERAAIDDLALEIGGSPASGAVALHVTPEPRLQVAVSASRLDLDAWLPVLLHTNTTIAGIDVPIGIDFSAEAAPLGGGMLEHVRAAFDLTSKAITVKVASAQLPGNGALRLSGQIARDDPLHPHFEGDLRLEAPMLRATLRWLDDAMPSVLPQHLLAVLPNAVAQRATLASHIVGSDHNIALRDLVGSLDDAPMSGELDLKRGARPGFNADLSLDRLVLDPWLDRRLTLSEMARVAPGFDAALHLNVRHATWADEPVDGLTVDMAIEADSILLRRLSGTMRGVQLTASATIRDGGQVSGGKLALATKDATPLSDLLPPAWRAAPAFWHSPARLDVEFTGPQDALASHARLALADARVDARSVLDLKSQTWDATVTMRHPGARRLIAALGLTEPEALQALPNWLGDGSVSLVAHLSGKPEQLAARDFELTAAAVHARGSLVVDEAGAEPRVSGQITADELMLPLPSTSSDVPLPLYVLRGWKGQLQLAVGRLPLGAGPAFSDASGTLSLADNLLRIEKFTAKLGSGTVAGSFTCDAGANPPSVSLQGTVGGAVITGSVGDAPVRLLSGRTDAHVELAARGYSPSAILATLNGHAELLVNDGTLAGFDLFQLKRAVESQDPKSTESAAREALLTGASGFDHLQLVASISHGDLTLDDGRLTGIGGEATISGAMDIANRYIDARIALQPSVSNPPEVTIHLSGPFSRPNRALELAGLARWMADLAH